MIGTGWFAGYSCTGMDCRCGGIAGDIYNAGKQDWAGIFMPLVEMKMPLFYRASVLIKVKLIVYGIAGALAAVGGIMVTSRLDSAQPNAGTGYELRRYCRCGNWWNFFIGW